MLSKKNILIFVGILLLVVAVMSAVWYKRAGRSDNMNVSLENQEQLFNVVAPADFDDAKKERLAGKLAEAKDLYGKDKNNNWTWVVIGNMYEFIRDYDRAIPAYEKAIEFNKSTISAVLSLADIYERQKKNYSLAAEYYQKAITIDYTKPDVYISLAKLYEFRLNQLDKSEGVYLQGLQNLEDDPDLLVGLITFYQRINDTTKAGEYTKKLLARYPDNTSFQKDFGGLIK
ncbi:MAG: tetratricopeptide repeat protein [Candidatus Magasanikbacteria bacterium]|nr:tetratricopeptide repeat protein [Candidatus Magasanikbacteria bacterium]